MTEWVRIKDKTTGHHYTLAAEVVDGLDKAAYSLSRESALLPSGAIRPPKFNLSPAVERSSTPTLADAAEDKEN